MPVLSNVKKLEGGERGIFPWFLTPVLSNVKKLEGGEERHFLVSGACTV